LNAELTPQICPALAGYKVKSGAATRNADSSSAGYYAQVCWRVPS